jgi:Domain of unknown function DUF11
VGDTVHFRVTVTNKGPSDAARFEVVDRPHRLTVRSVRVSGGAVRADARSWSVPGLAAGHTIVLSMTATVNAVGARNVARIEHATTPDPDRADNGGANCRPGTVGCGLVELDVTALANTGEPIGGLLALSCGLLLTGVGTLLLTRSRRT